MKAAALLPLILIASACEEPDRARQHLPPTAEAPKERFPPAPQPEEIGEPKLPSGNGRQAAAAQVAQDYYALISSRQYARAFRLREAGKRGPTPEQFAASFASYGEYRANVGPPSEPVAAGEWVYVEVPVQTYGSFKDGKPFSSAGTVTLRRRAAGGEWRIYPG
jgi:hypothetical protein